MSVGLAVSSGYENDGENSSTVHQRSLLDRLIPCEPLDLILQLTLLMILLFGGIRWYHRGLVQMLAACGLISRRLSRHPAYWLFLGMTNLLLGNLHTWAVADNHKWLFTYWYVAIALSLWSRDAEETLSANARLLVGLTFLFAVLRKALSTEYLSGAAFRFLLQVDSRFFEPAKAIAGHTQDSRPIWRTMAELDPTVTLAASPALDRLATALTWWTLAIEIAIAATFLLPHPAFARVRHLLLLVFVATTYPVAPVLGFAWVLLIMGLTQVGPARRAGRGAPGDAGTAGPGSGKARFAYLAALVLTFALQGERLKMTLVEWWFGSEFFRIGA